MKSTSITRMALLALITIMTSIALAGTSLAAQPGSVTNDSPAQGELYKKYGVAPAVRAGDFLFIGGLVAFNDDGSVYAPNDGKRQVAKILSRLQSILAAHNADMKNVVKMNSFITDWEEFNKGGGLIAESFHKDGAAYPSGTGVGVPSLAVPGLVVEIDFIAYLGK